MADTEQGRVAVYLDFDNIIISWYDRVHGRNAFSRDRQSIAQNPNDPEIAERLSAARVDVGALIDYASSFGTLVLTRAYADWSSPMNAEYRNQLVARAVDLVQLFPAAAYAKNGADIRLAVDAVEDMFRLDDLSHMVIVAGDSDYVPLAQRCKRLGRYVVGIGVAGSTAKSLAAAVDEFATYESLPGIELPQPVSHTGRNKGAKGGAEARARSEAATETAADPSAGTQKKRSQNASEPAAQKDPSPRHEGDTDFHDEDDDEQRDTAVTGLLIRALWLGLEKEDSGWLHSSAVKQQMRRMDPSFNEKALGFRSFSDFLKSRSQVVELEESGHERLVRFKEQA
ncbi:NYN domain-containing protein [Leucobacter chinensis]|uniref:NYN domain-containing protein n=1 Tax=Leucobacter chinensis TaxID=2851010 RepID=UPI001C24EBDB|nr:NYN domain-containing protein [Leucobacter chinensis]